MFEMNLRVADVEVKIVKDDVKLSRVWGVQKVGQDGAAAVLPVSGHL